MGGFILHPLWARASPVLVPTRVTAPRHVSGLCIIATSMLMSFLAPPGPLAYEALVCCPFRLPLAQLASSLQLVSVGTQPPGHAAGLAPSPACSPTTRAFASTVPSAGNAIPLALGLTASEMSPIF